MTSASQSPLGSGPKPEPPALGQPLTLITNPFESLFLLSVSCTSLMHEKYLAPYEVCYLLHFSTPYHHARHYLGSTTNLKRRISEHRSSNASHLTSAVNRAGIGWHLVRIWEGGEELEYKLKGQHNGPRLCPVCNPPAQLFLELPAWASVGEVAF